MKKQTSRKRGAQTGVASPAGGYAVRFRLQIHGAFACISSEDVWMERIVTLPIPPAAGMEVSQGDWSATIVTVYVDLDAIPAIEAFVEDDKTIYNAQLHHREHPPLAEIVKEYKEAGWKVERRDRHNIKVTHE